MLASLIALFTWSSWAWSSACAVPPGAAGRSCEVGDDLVDVGVAVDVDRVGPSTSSSPSFETLVSQVLGIDPELLEDRGGAPGCPACALACLADCS